MPIKKIHNERELLALIARGDENAFRQLVSHYANPLHNYLFQITQSRELAEEVVQDILTQLWINRELLIGVRNLTNYIGVISRNHAYDALKKLSRERKRNQNWQLGQLMSVDPRHQAEKEQQFALLEAAIKQLPTQQRQAWLLSRREQKKYSEIAGIMNLSTETVKKYIHYATDSIIGYIKKYPELLIIEAIVIL